MTKRNSAFMIGLLLVLEEAGTLLLLIAELGSGCGYCIADISIGVVASAAVRGSKMYDFRCVRTVYNFFKIKEKRLWNSLTLLSKFFRLWLSLWVPDV